jgi:hypothetical protein
VIGQLLTVYAMWITIIYHSCKCTCVNGQSIHATCHVNLGSLGTILKNMVSWMDTFVMVK